MLAYGVRGDDPFLVGRLDDDPYSAARIGDRRRVRVVGVVVDAHAEPVERGADPLAQHGAVLADAGREGQHVEAAEHRGQCADLAHDATHVQLQRRARAFVARLDVEQRLRTRRDTGDAEQARLVIEQMRESLDAELLVLDEVQHHTGVERAAARAHHQTVERGKAHRRGDASQAPHRAQAGAAAQMRDDRASARAIAMPLGQRDGHVLVREPVKTIAPDTTLPQRIRQWKHLFHLRKRPVERRVEARHLRQVRGLGEQGLDRLQRERLVQRRQGM